MSFVHGPRADLLPPPQQMIRKPATKTDVAVGQVMGFGPTSYLLALRGLVSVLERSVYDHGTHERRSPTCTTITSTARCLRYGASRQRMRPEVLVQLSGPSTTSSPIVSVSAAAPETRSISALRRARSSTL